MRMPWVDFKAIKQSVSVELALAYYGVMLRSIHSPYLRGRCPLPTHTSKSSTQSFFVNTEKNAWVCHSDSCVASRGGRSGGNVLDFVAAMERCSVHDAALKLQNWFFVTPTARGQKQIVSATPEAYPSTSTAPEENNKPLAFTLQGIDPHHPYLAERSVDTNTAAYFGIGFYSGKGLMEGRIIFPIHDEDRNPGGLRWKGPRTNRTEVQVSGSFPQVARTLQSAPRRSPRESRYRGRRVL